MLISCAVNYAARAAGVSRMDNVTSARAKCPGLVTVHTETIDCPDVHESDGTGSDSDAGHPRSVVSGVLLLRLANQNRSQQVYAHVCAAI